MTGKGGRIRRWARRRFDDDSITRQRIKPGTVRRIVPYALRFPWLLSALLLATVAEAVFTALSPLILKAIIDEGIIPRRFGVVLWLCAAVVGLALMSAAVDYMRTWCAGRVGEGLVYVLRTKVFDHVQRQPLAFFTRAQTGALISRLNSDVIGARRAVTSLLVGSVSTILTLLLVVGAMFYLSWQLALASLALIPLFLLPIRLIARRVQRLTRAGMELEADMGSLMNERFNVAGAMLGQLYGRQDEESEAFAARAGRLRDIQVRGIAVDRMTSQLVGVLTALITAVVYGLGAALIIDGRLQLGTLVAMVALLLRLYGPVDQLSTIQVDAMTALVSFDRLFEILDLKPLISDRPGARDLPAGREAPDIEFDRVSFRYPTAEEVSLASLESIAKRGVEKTSDAWTLDGLSFRAPAGRLTALVGPSGAGKTTITQLVPRLYDVGAGALRIGGHDVRDLTLRSVREAVGVVTQDAHLFHDTLRANLEYARPGVTEREIVEACVAARIWDMVEALPDGLDTVVGDRGYRLSGGEKQRIALARLLVKAPPVVVLDEATAHLDSESEAAIQRALRSALAGRTSLVIAHRLSTIREADQILVVEAGRIRESGTHEELLSLGGLYADLYRTQFAGQAGDDPAVRST
ncbi:ABC transporter ATP-binding protein [Actinomadura litoris]|uniref:ABC transporter ATP-binding protein n=1 Tax=Actinomadura litoris TaxID=2678616 RepID=UPI001FA6FF38|nr:ABC transporter ATP-binding protein [Actinomadura litoris]